MKALPTRVEQRLENARATEIAKWAGLLLAAIGFLDFATGLEVSVSFFYLIPVALAAWFGPKGWQRGRNVQVFGSGRMGFSMFF